MKRVVHFLLCACLFVCTAAAAAAQTLTSDKPDYAPGETCTLTGSGFVANETVTLQVLHADGTPDSGEDHQPWTVTAGPDGGFVTTWHVCEDDCVGSLLRATATGASGRSAFAEFTDDCISDVTVSGGPASYTSNNNIGSWHIVPGGSYTMTIANVTCTGNTITVFYQNNGNAYCFNATRVGSSNTFSGPFVFGGSPLTNCLCNTGPITYSCGADQPCTGQGTNNPKGGCSNAVHLAASSNGTPSGDISNCNCVLCTPPVITCPPNRTLQCGDPTDPASTGTATVTGTCEAHIVGFSDRNVGGCTGRDIDRTWTATNSAGQTVTCVQQIRFVDTTKPVIENLPAGGDLGCNPTPPSCEAGVTATDNCDTDVPVSCTPGAVTSTGCLRSQTFVYSATDDCGNSDSKSVTYTWKVDTTKPVLSNVPAGGDLGCNPSALPACDSRVAASDDCDATVTVHCEAGAIEEDGCHRSQTFTYSAVDACGNEISQTAKYTWTEDHTGPVLSNLPEGGDLHCNPETLPSCDSRVTANDDCSGPAHVDCSAGPIRENGCLRTQVFTYSAKDACGNETSQEVAYNWKVDKTAPTFDNLPTGRDLGCNPTAPTCDAGVTATDDCGDATVSCASGDVREDGCHRSQDFTYKATDECGNVNTQVVTYTWTEDHTGPVLSNLPKGGELGCNPTRPVCATDVTANDACSGTAEVHCAAGDVQVDGCLRTQVFTYSATDACGNETSETATYTWKEDHDPPVFDNLPDGGDLGCNPTPPVCADVTATDVCDGAVHVSCTPGRVMEEGCMRSQTFTYVAYDKCGNRAMQDVNYVWKVDTTPPTFVDCKDGTFNLGCNPANIPGCEVDNIHATDDCGHVTVTCEVVDGKGEKDPGPAPAPAPGGGKMGESACLHTRSIIYTATDDCGNKATCTQVYTWTVDTTPPTFDNCTSGDRDLGCNPDPTSIPVCDPNVTASDDCGAASVECASSDEVVGCKHTRTLTYTATDGCGNKSECIQHITWTVDTEKPVLQNLPAGGDIGCNPANPPSCSADVTATDNCGDATVTCIAGDIVADGCHRSQTFTYTATDECHNSDSRTVTYTWTEDTTKPVLAGVPAGGDLGCNPRPPSCDSRVTARDDCDPNVTVHCDAGPVTGTGCNKSQTFTYSATDACGNRASQDVTYTWKDDKVPPVVTCSDVTVTINPGDPCPAPVTFTNITANDNCDGPVSYTLDNPGPYSPGTTTVVVSAVDACGNRGTCSFKVIVKSAVCVNKFNDYNVNGTQDAGEPGVQGVTFTLNPGGLTAVTDASGKACFTGLAAGNYTVTETVPSGWFGTTSTAQTVTLGCPTTLQFGNIRLGGCGGLTLGYWSNKNGQALETSADFAILTALCLRNADGTNRDFTGTLAANKTALNAWLLSANATNMANMLSAQLTAMRLNVSHGMVSGTALVYAPGCGNTGPGNNFISVNDLMTAANNQLCANPVTLSGNPNRAAQECLKIALDNANNNTNFVVTPNCPQGSTSVGRNNGNSMN